jgi:ABC-type molybdate transport system substrate-binding protein
MTQRRNANGLVRIFSARACAAPLERAAKLFEQRTGITIEIIGMPKDQQVARGTCVGMLSFAHQPRLAEQFMDLLASPESRRFYKEYGWIVPDE